MEPVQVKALAHKIWMAEYRITDLLTQVHAEKWKTSNVTRNSFNQTLENLHKALEGLGNGARSLKSVRIACTSDFRPTRG